jgi:hypothetical protein
VTRQPDGGASGGAAPLDVLVERLLHAYPYRFAVARDDAEREIGYRIRYDAVVGMGWLPAEALAGGLECDAYDERAVHVVGWDGETPIATGRLVLPPGRLPTEEAWDIVVEPRGEVVDVGRMSVVRGHQSTRHGAFVALLCRLYLEMRERGFGYACGIMSPAVRALVRQLGLRLDVLADERPYWGEPRAPVRFGLDANERAIGARWPVDR